MSDGVIARLVDESFDDYFVRLFENKNVYGINCEQIADLLNTESGSSFTECKWRKDFRNFARGRAYERKKFGDSALSAQARELTKQRMRLADERAAINRLIREDARKDALLEEIKEQFAAYESIQYSPSRAMEDSTGGTLVAIVSDWHIGLEIDNRCGKYDSDIALAYVNEYAAYVIENAQKLGATNCVVALAGDLISGVIHNTIRIENREALVKQIKLASEYLSLFLSKIASAFSCVDVYGVGGNHSRATEYSETMLGDMLDDLVPFYVEARLKDIDNLSIHERGDDCAFDLFKIGTLNCVLVHGDWDSMNAQGIAKLERLTGEVVNLVIAGHLHESMFIAIEGAYVLRSGTFAGGGDAYSVKNRLTCEPSQMMAYFDRDSKLRAVLPVFFSTEP